MAVSSASNYKGMHLISSQSTEKALPLCDHWECLEKRKRCSQREGDTLIINLHVACEPKYRIMFKQCDISKSIPVFCLHPDETTAYYQIVGQENSMGGNMVDFSSKLSQAQSNS